MDVKRYYCALITDAGNVPASRADHYVRAEDFDRVTAELKQANDLLALKDSNLEKILDLKNRYMAERDALQEQLNKADEEIDRYEQLWLASTESAKLKSITIKFAIQHLETCTEKLIGIAPASYIAALDAFIKEKKL